MIKIYISPSCSSCRKVKEWFECQNIPHELINIFSGDITKDDIKEILRKSLDGTDEIISTRSNAFKNLNKSIDDMTLDELIAFVEENPSVLKRPIIVDDRKIQVGYNSEEIRAFIPQARRIFKDNCNASCPKYPNCPSRLED